MDNLLNYNSKEINFISIFNKILISFLLIVVFLILVLPINHSIKTNKGEIVSKIPQKDFLSPFDAVLDSILVEEGDVVENGDTLLILNNNLLDKDYQNSIYSYTNFSENIASSENSIVNVSKKIKYIKEALKIAQHKYSIDKAKNQQELISAKNELNYFDEKLKVAKAKLRMDSNLFKKSVISKLEITNSYDEYLTYLNNFNSAKNKYQQKKIDRDMLANAFQTNKNELNNQLVILEEELASEQTNLKVTKNKLSNTKSTMDYFNTEIGKQYFIADIDGVVNQVYNFKTASSIINKNDLLVSVSPLENEFHAKIYIPQKDIWQIKVGQKVNIKIDAYYYYKFGITEGTVSYISERVNDNSEFYVLVDLENDRNVTQLRSGYSIKSEIIVEEMRLWQYILRGLFEKVDQVS